LLKLKEMEVDMRGAENDEPEMSFRRGYQQGAIEVFHAIERFLDPATREILQAWIEKDVFMWRVKAMLTTTPCTDSSFHCLLTRDSTQRARRLNGIRRLSAR
jgi:hypothetical protein